MKEKLSVLRKRLLELGGVILLLFLVIVVGFLYFRTKLEVSPPALLPEVKPVPVTYEPGNPIRKNVGSKAIVYDLEGRVAGGLSLDGGGMLRGTFVLKGDPLTRGIPFIFGSPSGQVYFGTYEGSFSGTSEWNAVSVEEVKRSVVSEEEVRMQVTLFTPETGGARDYNSAIEQVLDRLEGEFSRGEQMRVLPAGLILVPSRMGVVR